MTAETIIASAVVIAARALFAGLDELAAKADADEAAEIRRLLDASRARLDAAPPIASSLDSIRDRHLVRVRFVPGSTEPVEGVDPEND